jgi:pimeloyl-ACP methyl ester carboxylesterase
MQPLHHVAAGVLDVAYFEAGPADGHPVVLLHGFPYDIHAYAEVAPRLAAAGCRVIVPFLRGFGPTRFQHPDTPRSGEQAALGADLLALMDALAIPRAVLAGYDWGGRAACVVAALWPERCAGLVSFNSYNIQDIARALEPDTAANEHRLWYQYYFHSERGRAGLAKDRRAMARLLWQLWSPTWAFDDAAFECSAAAFDNPDFVGVVIQSYRHRFGLAPGDPAGADIERRPQHASGSTEGLCRGRAGAGAIRADTLTLATPKDCCHGNSRTRRTRPRCAAQRLLGRKGLQVAHGAGVRSDHRRRGR